MTHTATDIIKLQRTRPPAPARSSSLSFPDGSASNSNRCPEDKTNPESGWMAPHKPPHKPPQKLHEVSGSH